MARKSTFIKILSIIAAAAFISVVGTLSAEAAYKPGERAIKFGMMIERFKAGNIP